MPFEWRTPYGYLIALTIESIVITCIIFSSFPHICFFIGSCLSISSFMDDIQNDLTALMLTKRGLNRNDERVLKQSLCKIVQDVSDAKELSYEIFHLFSWEKIKQIKSIFFHFSLVNQLNNIYSFHITNACFWSLLTISNTLLMLNLELVEYFYYLSFLSS